MDEPLEWNTLEEAAAYLTEATGKEWTPRMVVSACLKHYKIGSHRKPKPSLLKAAPSIDTPISVYQFKVGEGLVKQTAGMPPQLFPLYLAQLGDLLTRGKTYVGLVHGPEEDSGKENEYVMADERTCVDLSQVGISRRALVELFEIVSGHTDVPTSANTPAQLSKPALAAGRPKGDDQGKPKKESAWPAQLVERAKNAADEIALKRFRAGAGKFSARSIAPDIAASWRKDESTWGKSEPRGEGDIRNNGLKGWRFVPPSGPAGKAGKIGNTRKKKMSR